MKITITRWNIDEGQRGDGGNCPFARALSDKYPNASHIGVNAIYASVRDFEITLTWKMSGEACAWVMSFDAGAPVEPGTFNLTRAEGN